MSYRLTSEAVGAALVLSSKKSAAFTRHRLAFSMCPDLVRFLIVLSSISDAKGERNDFILPMAV